MVTKGSHRDRGICSRICGNTRWVSSRGPRFEFAPRALHVLLLYSTPRAVTSWAASCKFWLSSRSVRWGTRVWCESEWCTVAVDCRRNCVPCLRVTYYASAFFFTSFKEVGTRSERIQKRETQNSIFKMARQYPIYPSANYTKFIP